MFKSPTALSSAIEEMTIKMAENSDGKMRIALNEADDKKNADPEAQKFLKVNEKRLGRDFKVYDIMACAGTKASAFTAVLEEIVLPLKIEHPSCYETALDYMENNASIVELAVQKDWCFLIQSLRT